MQLQQADHQVAVLYVFNIGVECVSVLHSILSLFIVYVHL